MTGLEHAVLGLRQALDAPRRGRTWRWLVRHRMAAVVEALGVGAARGGDAWLAARESSLARERAALADRLRRLGPRVSEEADFEPVREELLRLVVDLEHHRQHLHDLVYDSVSLELGGSE